jgi:hypothetical protein
MKCKQNFDSLHCATFSRQPNALKKSKENTAKPKKALKQNRKPKKTKRRIERKKHIQVRGNGCGGACSERNKTLEKRSDDSTRGAVTVDLRREDEAIAAENEKVLCTNRAFLTLLE